MKRYRFLLDRDVERAALDLPRKSALTLSRVGLQENARDADIVREAYERRCIIVTSNGLDFTAAIKEFQRHTAKGTCRELWGLVVLPSGYETQRRILGDAGKRLRFGGKPITWADVAHQNYLVKLRRSGPPEVKRLPRCSYCKHHEV